MLLGPHSNHQSPSPEEEAIAQKSKSPIAKIIKLIPFGILIFGGLFLWISLGLEDIFSLSTLQTHRTTILDWVQDNRESALLTFMGIYILAVGFSFPVGTFMTILSGFLFGTLLGGSISIVSATLGSYVVFLAARTAFRDIFRNKAKHLIARIRHHFEDQAFSYLLFLRLVPVFPFWLINIVPAFTNVSSGIFLLATFLGALPATFIFASFGSGLGKILDMGMEPSFDILLEPSVFMPLAGLGVLALLPVLYRNRKKLKKLFKKSP